MKNRKKELHRIDLENKILGILFSLTLGFILMSWLNKKEFFLIRGWIILAIFVLAWIINSIYKLFLCYNREKELRILIKGKLRAYVIVTYFKSLRYNEKFMKKDLGIHCRLDNKNYYLLYYVEFLKLIKKQYAMINYKEFSKCDRAAALCLALVSSPILITDSIYYKNTCKVDNISFAIECALAYACITLDNFGRDAYNKLGAYLEECTLDEGSLIIVSALFQKCN